MTIKELENLIAGGEHTTVQFKMDVNNAQSIAQEMVAFANTLGGRLIIGIDDRTGEIKGLDYQSIQRISNLLTTAANEQVKPAIIIQTETISVNDKPILIAHIPQGTALHKDKDGLVFVKNGPDKRKVTSNEELARLLQRAGQLYAEERQIPRTGIQDIDRELFAEFYRKKYEEEVNWKEAEQLLANLRLADDGQINTAGLLLFGRQPELLLPSFYIAAVWFWGNDVADLDYRASENLYGHIGRLYQQAFDFIWSKIDKIQKDKSFNSLGDPEIPKIVIEELLINALIHRDYFIQDAIKLFVFDDRIEIRSPGTLPNRLTAEQVLHGVRKTRNPILASFAFDLLPYRGIGSGLLRALKAYPHIQLINDTEAEEVKVIIQRVNRPLVRPK